MKITCILLFEEIVFVFFQLLTEIEELLIVDAHIAEIAADAADPLGRIRDLAFHDPGFNGIEFPVEFLQQDLIL